MKSFPTWKQAHTYAVETARLCKRDCSLAKSREFGREVFNVSLLPDFKNRCGHELTCEVVSPDSPI